jgi:hypothetical protein
MPFLVALTGKGFFSHHRMSVQKGYRGVKRLALTLRCRLASRCSPSPASFAHHYPIIVSRIRAHTALGLDFYNVSMAVNRAGFDSLELIQKVVE